MKKTAYMKQIYQHNKDEYRAHYKNMAYGDCTARDKAMAEKLNREGAEKLGMTITTTDAKQFRTYHTDIRMDTVAKPTLKPARPIARPETVRAPDPNSAMMVAALHDILAVVKSLRDEVKALRVATQPTQKDANHD